jgi:hypothetical protein
MKLNFKIILSLCTLFTYTLSISQNFCGQSEVLNNWLKVHPEYAKVFEQSQQKIIESNIQTKTTNSQSLAPTYTVPVVFHILHLGGSENISDAQVNDQITILNRDYQRQNADTASVIPTYTNNIANVRFAFQLARIDPNGNCTNGIIRHYTSDANWDANNLSLFTYSWPTTMYLNIYVIKTMNIQATAYAFLPGTPIPVGADVIVSLHTQIGSIGTGNPGTTSRVITHEVGHWFNLQHIWGTSNQPGVTCGDDLVTDTPITKGFSVCTNPNNAIVCTPGIIENMQNYMDYSPCKLMFTNGQATRMLATINSTVNGRNNISSTPNLLATGITTTAPACLPMVGITAPANNTVCVGNSLSLSSFTYNANNTSYSWTANNGATLNSPSSANASVTFNTLGNSTVVCTVTNSNGIGTASIVVTALNGLAQANTIAESFEAALLPTNWAVLNATTLNAKWDMTNVAAASGVKSMYVNTENTPNGSVEILETPSMDFLNNPNALFTYKYAYARQSATHGDIYKLQASKDCGGSWIDVYVPSMSSFANGSGGISNVLFTPTATQWKFHNATPNLNLYNLLSEPNVRLRFYFQEDAAAGFGNRIYLDDINFSIPTGINEWSKAVHFSVSPNPSSGSLKVNFQLSESTQVKWEIVSLTGSVVLLKNEQNFPSGENSIIINETNYLSKGIYFLNTYFNGVRLVRKIVVE